MKTQLLALLAVLGPHLCGCCASSQPIAAAPPGSPSFSLASHTDVDTLRTGIANAKAKCITVLHNYAGVSHDSALKDHAIKAALLLGELGANDEGSQLALAANLSLRDRTVGAPHPLDGFVAANAICKSGSQHAIRTIQRKMSAETNHQELLICSHIIYQLDGREVALVLAEKMRDHRTDEPFSSNVQALSELLTSPDFPANRKYWPGECPPPTKDRVARLGTLGR